MKIRRMVVLLLLAVALDGQDGTWVRTWSEAQGHRPANLTAAGRIATVREPGTPMIVHGRVYQRDGKTPAPGIVVFAYQTDATGVYNRGDAPGWRLRGWAKTDAAGKFEFRTIRPGSYPGTRTPSHIHLIIEGPNLPRRMTSELNFMDDPFVSESSKRASAAEGLFGSIRPVSLRNGVQHVELNLRIADRGKF